MEFANKLTALLAGLFGLVMYIVNVAPQLQQGIDQIGMKLIVLLPPQWQSIVGIILTAIGVIVAIIIYVYNYTTSRRLADEKLYTPPPKE